MAKLTYLSHSSWLVETDDFTIAIDPFLEGNPLAQKKPSDIKADFIVVTHAHGDHLGDSIPMAKQSGGTIISNFEIANYCAEKGANVHPMHIGGAHGFPFGMVKLTPAWHGSSFPDGGYGGTPAGVLLTVAGKTIYHTGDTGLFLDMQLIGEMHPVDIFLVNIGDNFTMGIDDAVKAVEFVKPKLTIPMHYKTFDVIDVNPQEFIDKVEAKGFTAKLMNIGEAYEF